MSKRLPEPLTNHPLAVDRCFKPLRSGEWIHGRTLVEILRVLAQCKVGIGTVRVRVKPQQYNAEIVELIDRIAAVISKSYAERGDATQLADDEAIEMIRDILIAFDPAIIKRNKNRRTPCL